MEGFLKVIVGPSIQALKHCSFLLYYMMFMAFDLPNGGPSCPSGLC